jgi:hypothetical protein
VAGFAGATRAYPRSNGARDDSKHPGYGRGMATQKQRQELESQARGLEIRGRSKMGKAELKRAVARAKR